MKILLSRMSHGPINMGIVTLALILVSLAVSSNKALAVDSMPAAGSEAPAFKLQSQEGTEVSLDQFRGKWVVLYFYPKDFTGGCTREAHNFQRDIEKYQQKNAVIVGISVDTVDSHKGFCAKEGLNFKLLADTKHSVSEMYGSTMEYKGQTYSERNTFLIDPSGVIRKVYSKVDPGKHSDDVLADLDQLQSQKK